MPLAAMPLSRPRGREIAQEMRAGGWRTTAIREYLAVHGIDVSYDTVRRWADPAYEEMQFRRVRLIRRRRRGASPPRMVLTAADRILGRMLQLDRIHVSATSIAAIVTLDHHVACSAYEVRYALRNRTLPLQLSKRVEP